MKTPKTDAQVVREVATLKRIKPFVRRFSLFGDDNHHAIDVAIDVLEHELYETEIEEKYENEDDSSHAYAALAWRQGDEDESPSAGFAPLVVKKEKATTRSKTHRAVKNV